MTEMEIHPSGPIHSVPSFFEQLLMISFINYIIDFSINDEFSCNITVKF